ncbi:MAG: gluconate 2-dehydrogenase subunit 3 family protein [Flavisolibacter sp.]
MTRREAVQHISVLLGGTLVGANSFLSGCNSTDKKGTLLEDDIFYLDEIAETILPATSTPGAKAAKVGEFIAVMVNDCYDDKEQQVFIDGMKKINELSKKQFGDSFLKIDPQQRHQLLVQLDKEQKEFMKKKSPEQSSHYFRMMKEMTLLGYFTSEPGCTKAKRYIPVPGRFEGCVPYKKGDKAYV